MKALFVYYGINLNRFRVEASVMSQNIDLTILVLSEYGDSHSIFVELNKRFIDSLKKTNGSQYNATLWYYLIVNFRRWLTRRERVSIKELLSPRLLYEMEATEDLIQIFNDKFDSREWDNEMLAENFDAAIVGMHITKIIINNPTLCRSITFNDLAEIVLFSRNSNWYKLA